MPSKRGRRAELQHLVRQRREEVEVDDSLIRGLWIYCASLSLAQLRGVTRLVRVLLADLEALADRLAAAGSEERAT